MAIHYIHPIVETVFGDIYLRQLYIEMLHGKTSIIITVQLSKMWNPCMSFGSNNCTWGKQG